MARREVWEGMTPIYRLNGCTHCAGLNMHFQCSMWVFDFNLTKKGLTLTITMTEPRVNGYENFDSYILLATIEEYK